MLFTTFYAKIKKTQWFCLLFCAPGDDLARLTGAQNGPDATKTKKTQCFSLLVMQKSRKLNGFAYFLVPPSTTSPGSPGSLSTAATISKSNENTMFVITFCRKAVKTQCFFQYFLRKSFENTMFFNGFVARRTVALKNKENSMFFTTCYAKIKTTLWFC